MSDMIADVTAGTGISTRTDAARPATRHGRVAGGGLLLGVAVVLVALNLRPAITSVGPVLGQARDGLGASATWAGLLTTIPGLCFALAGLAAPALARRAGTTAAVALSMTVLACGLLARVLGGPVLVLAGTMVATGGIALANVLVPVVVKSSFPARIGLMTGMYTAALQGGGALGSAVTAPLGAALGGWRPALASWAALAVVALVVWSLAARARRRAEPADPRAARETVPASQGPARSLLRSPLAWVVTVFFGLQACLAYVLMGWLPLVLIDAGVSQGDAGLYVGALSLVGVPVSLTVPALAARRRSQSGWIVGLGVIGLTGMVGLMLAPTTVPLLWTLLIGTGMSVFSLALTLLALRARTGEDTARLSGMAQGFGYLLAAVGPFLFGLLHDISGGWTVPLLMLIGVLLAQMLFGWVAGRPRYV
ncbi:MFS transporter, CP family, cyanate transporter [Haloechinothrix alba]|uniref:MFS transporter, CP family, cyanate transporter n=1 Tax=Haloechinothrix alba TaxID=664784 RepID=A0A238WS65_9PSEU|nr:MFS transporter [Haloechinothrix alba]SNR49375.1 MFS transporter, CP family, cyanate transporter [Haloechinothrix alba]